VTGGLPRLGDASKTAKKKRNEIKQRDNKAQAEYEKMPGRS
jgi:hypothetical protein